MSLIHWLCANVDLGRRGKTQRRISFAIHPTESSPPCRWLVPHRWSARHATADRSAKYLDRTSVPSLAFSSGSAATAIETIFPERSFLNIYHSLSASSRLQSFPYTHHVSFSRLQFIYTVPSVSMRLKLVATNRDILL